MGLKQTIRRLTPSPLIGAYHYVLAYLGAFMYGFPSRKLIVIGVTGTNGKSSTTEFINAIFEAAGYTTALSNSIRMKIAAHSEHSSGRSMPGRFFIQRLLRRALDAGCTVAIVEMTSEGAKQHRHRGIALNCLVFLNLAPEHIESHGSYQAYADAKFQLGLGLARSSKRPRIMVANADDSESARYLALPVETSIGFKLSAGQWSADERGGTLHFGHADIAVKLPGTFYVQNALAAAEVGHAFGISDDAIKRGIERVTSIPGRMQTIDEGQSFSVIVDYALTPDALEALYKTYATRKKICVFGSAGGGRDTWKRPVLGKIAETYCEEVILTNDIAYDESPKKILADIASGMKHPPVIIPNRREAIRRAFEHADSATVVLITGMGIDTEISTPEGKKIAWSDVEVAREELHALQGKQV